MRLLITAVVLFVLAGCSVIAKHQLDEKYGLASVRERVSSHMAGEPEYYRDIKPILDNRCVVCHGCYDAPCQLKLSSFEGVDRGASKHKVYNGTRLLASELSRLFEDADNTQQWRSKGFYPVLNERQQAQAANLEGSVLYRLLQLKQTHPLPDTKTLPSSFDLSLDRNQQCPKIEQINEFEANYPLWGMPYGLPALSQQEFNMVERWLATGARAALQPELNADLALQIAQWEAFLNGNSHQEKLVARYIFEHLYIANIYFDDLQAQPTYFRLVRSKTPPGVNIDVIASRRPFDDPGVSQFYYRFQLVKETITAKRHMPYKLNRQRLARWQELFFTGDYEVTKMPGYEPSAAANPFVTFQQLPVMARYRFMLEEARFTISGFIKGPVCRGQVALNVIDDHFWVLFIEPEDQLMHNVELFLEKESKYLRLPAEHGSQTLPIINWLTYSKSQTEYLKAKNRLSKDYYPNGKAVDFDLLWDGDGNNNNLALTVFRHFDSATVEKGLLGDTPKTAWVIGYPLLERIHYLLVAGFDVYGNAGHQLLTRLYMDFLRMEGERNFLAFMPSQYARQQLDYWYRGEQESIEPYIRSIAKQNDKDLAISYQSDNPKKEFFELFRTRVDKKLIPADTLNGGIAKQTTNEKTFWLQRLAAMQGPAISLLPEVILIRVKPKQGAAEVYSLLSNRARSNVLTLFHEDETLLPDEQTVTLLKGFYGAYPNVFLDVSEAELPAMVNALLAMNTEQDYVRVLDNYAVRRTAKNFWPFSDWLNQHYRKIQPINAGVLDYNRLQNR